MAETNLIERLNLRVDEQIDDNLAYIKAADALMLEAASALSESDKRVAGLEKLLAAVRDDAMRADHELCETESRVEVVVRERDASRAECEGLRAERDEARKKLNACHWFWPEDDTSSECCAESAQDVVQNIYEWTPKAAGGVVAVARGGIVEITYCASLPPADDADSDDDFWVEEATHEAAQAKIDTEKARRAALSRKEAGA